MFLLLKPVVYEVESGRKGLCVLYVASKLWPVVLLRCSLASSTDKHWCLGTLPAHGGVQGISTWQPAAAACWNWLEFDMNNTVINHTQHLGNKAPEKHFVHAVPCLEPRHTNQAAHTALLYTTTTHPVSCACCRTHHPQLPSASAGSSGAARPAQEAARQHSPQQHEHPHPASAPRGAFWHHKTLNSHQKQQQWGQVSSSEASMPGSRQPGCCWT